MSDDGPGWRIGEFLFSGWLAGGSGSKLEAPPADEKISRLL